MRRVEAEEKIFREDLVEKRPPLYVYKAKRMGKDCFLNEIIPYITTEKKAILDFLKTVKQFSDTTYSDIANIVDFKKKGIRILVMEEAIEGQNLKYLVNQNKPVKPDAAIVLIYSIAHAFQKFHALGIHGLGIESKNIIIKDAKHISILHPTFPMAERFFRKTDKPEILNPRYLSPEQIKENVFSEKGDLFNVGILLFELLNSIYPFSSGTYQLLDFRKYVPNCIKHITERLLAFDPEKRFTSFHEFLQHLRECKEELTHEEKPAAVATQPGKGEPPRPERKKPEPEPPKVRKQQEKKEPKAKKEKPKPPAEKPKPRPKPKKRPRRMPLKKPRLPSIKFTIPKKPLIIGAAVFVALVLLILFVPRIIRMVRPYQIASLSVERNHLKALDEQGNEKWSFNAGADITYRKRIDIDGDERREILLGTSTVLTTESGARKKAYDSAQFFVLNANGRVLHRSEVGMTSIYEGGSSRWSIYDVHLIDVNNDGHLDFLPLAISDDSLDCMLLATIQKGITLSFWHTGEISLITLQQMMDGSPALVCGATNSRTGDKPVVFALDARGCNDQSPPWGGSLGEQAGLLWYRFMRGGGTITSIEKLDDTLHVTTAQGREWRCSLDGSEVVATDTTEEMVTARAQAYASAIEIFRSAMEARKVNDTESMLSLLNEGLQLEQELPALKSIFHYMKGKFYLKQKQWKSATNAFTAAIRADAGYYGPLLELGDAYQERMQFKNAASSYSRAYELSGKETHYYRMIDSYVAIGEYQKARRAIEKLQGKAKNITLFLFASASIAREEGEFAAAIRSYEAILKREPQNLVAHILLSDAYADLNRDIEMADSIFRYVSSKDSMLASQHIETAAWILYRKSKFEEALRMINTAIEHVEALSETAVSARRRLPRIYYRKAIIAQPLGLKEEKEKAVSSARSSLFCRGYIKRQLDYLMGSP